jgi:hypothetical protein
MLDAFNTSVEETLPQFHVSNMDSVYITVEASKNSSHGKMVVVCLWYTVSWKK